MVTTAMGPLLRALRRFVRDRSGGVLVEFSLVLMVLLVLVFGIIDFGRLLYHQNALTAAVREGARYAAPLTDPTAASYTDSIKSRVIGYMVPFGSAPLRASDVTVAFNPAPGGGLYSISVTATRPDTMITPFPNLIGLGRVRTMTASATFRWERAP
jgi:Flp pilus assembly protein TadG